MKRFEIQNAAELWQKETSLPSIPTFSQRIDDILGNDGVQLGSVTELLGLPGTGKTQLCLQLCASVQVPKVLGGLNSKALYIDTNTNFTVSRFREILRASLQKCKELEPSIMVTEEDALNKVHYVKAYGLEKFCSFMHMLPQFIADNPNIRLIVIDSIIFPFKEGIPVKQRTGLLFRQMAELQRIIFENQIAVVVTNEMSTRVGLSSGSVVSAMGDAWSHRCNKRVLLTQAPGARVALMLKSNDAPTAAVAEFQITKDGVRDIN